jgi:hypothetical protein
MTDHPTHGTLVLDTRAPESDFKSIAAPLPLHFPDSMFHSSARAPHLVRLPPTTTTPPPHHTIPRARTAPHLSWLALHGPFITLYGTLPRTAPYLAPLYLFFGFLLFFCLPACIAYRFSLYS